MNSYQHYIRDEDWDHVKATLQSAAKYGSGDWKFSVRCAAQDDAVCGGRYCTFFDKESQVLSLTRLTTERAGAGQSQMLGLRRMAWPGRC